MQQSRRRASRRKPAAKPLAKPATQRVCTTVRVKGKPVRRCRTVAAPPKKPVVIAPVVPVIVPVTPAVAASSSKSAAPARLPAAPPVPVPVPPPAAPLAPLAAAYFWIDQADGLADVIGNSPPDYAFRHDGVENWAWVSRAGETLIVEPGRDGVVQYYFAPRATAPYLVRDSYYSYGFDGPELMQLYDNAGRIPRGGPTSRQRYDGEDLQRRGRALLSASWRQRQWDSAAARSWQRQQGYAFDTFGSRGSGWNSGWRDEWRAQSDWSAFERAERSRRPARRLEDERRDRRDAGYRFDQWHRSGARGAPPMPANPIVVPTATPIVSPAPIPPPTPRGVPPVVSRPVASPPATVTPLPAPPRRTWVEPAATPPSTPLAAPAALPTPQPVIAPAPVIAVPEVRPLPVPDPAIAAETERRRAAEAAAAARARADAEAAQAQAAAAQAQAEAAARAEAEAAQAQAAAAQAQAEAAALEARRAAEARAQADAAARAHAAAEAAAAAAAAAAAKPADSVDEPAKRLEPNEREQ